MNWEKIAKMSRSDLVEAFVEAENKRSSMAEELEHREKFVVAATRDEAMLSLKRLNIDNYHRKTLILTGSSYASRMMRGWKIKNDHVLLVPGWARGKYADEVRSNMQMCGVRLDRCRYAPSPETDRCDGPSNWGRLEMETLTDVNETLAKLLDRNIERSRNA